MEPETFGQRIMRISHDQNVSTRSAARLARAEIRLEDRLRTKKEKEKTDESD